MSSKDPIFTIDSPKQMKETVERLREYLRTYINQRGYSMYSADVFIDDILYGLGIALDPVLYRYTDGFRHFARKLRTYLIKHPTISSGNISEEMLEIHAKLNLLSIPKEIRGHQLTAAERLDWLRGAIVTTWAKKEG